MKPIVSAGYYYNLHAPTKHSFVRTSIAASRLSSLMTPEYARIVRIRQEEQDRRVRHNLRRRAIKKKDLLHKFQHRRLQNFLKEDDVVGCTRAPPVVPPPSPTTPVPPKRDLHHKKRSQIPKDWAFYRRNGFIWSDLGRTPKVRLALVVPPIAVKREREFIEQLLKKVEAEDILNRQRAKEQLKGVAAQRERLRKKVRLCAMAVVRSLVACRWQSNATTPRERQREQVHAK